MSTSLDQAFAQVDCARTRIIGLYFSGEYCRSCKEFTPILIEAYPQLLANGIDIVYVSSDKSAEQHDAYRAAQPWHALPYAAAAERRALRDEFGIKTIPALLFFDVQNQSLLARDGRSMIRDDCSEGISRLANMVSLEYDSDDVDF